MDSLLERLSQNLSKWFCWLGGFALLILTGIACFNMVLRPLGAPFPGAYELVGFFGALSVALPLGFAQIYRTHISVDILATRYSKKTSRIMNAINSFICFVFFIIVGWQTAKYATLIWRRGETSETLRIIYYPFVYIVSICCFLLSFILLIDFVKSIKQTKEK